MNTDNQDKVVNGLRFYTDGDTICCVHNRTFTNIQESPVGFGSTESEALQNFVLSCLDHLLRTRTEL